MCCARRTLKGRVRCRRDRVSSLLSWHCRRLDKKRTPWLSLRSSNASATSSGRLGHGEPAAMPETPICVMSTIISITSSLTFYLLLETMSARFSISVAGGGSSIAFGMVFPGIRFYGVDINPTEILIAQERAKLYEVADRCRFERISEGQALPVASDRFDICLCCSVLECITDPRVRRWCMQEMSRILRPGGLLFVTVPNRLWPFDIHNLYEAKKLKGWGWNYFPRLLKAPFVGSTLWELRRLARPALLRSQGNSFLQSFNPWLNFCLRKEGTTTD